MKYKKYPKYKSSGIEWLGEIPEHWEVRRLKYVLNERKILNKDKKIKKILSLSMYDGIIPYNERELKGGNKAKEDISSYKIVYPGDIVVNSMNIVAGSVGISKYHGIVSPVYYMLYPVNNNVSNIFYYYMFRSSSFQKSLFGLGNGILFKESSSGKLNTIRLRISMESLGNVILPLPPLSEQKAIANFLDKATAKIDDLIQKEEKLIKLLEEKKEALIKKAVTKGLDKKVKLKNSGIEWLGKIPEHWEVRRLKFIAKIESGKDQKEVVSETGKYPVYGSGGIFSYANDYLYDGESVLFGRKGTIDKPLYVKGKFWTVDTMYYTKINKNIFPRWFFYTSKLIPFTMFLYGTALPSISQEDLKNILIPLPPLQEQKQIAEYLDKKLAQIDKLIQKSKKAIELLKEKKEALITNAVTGKIDVRESYET